MARITTLSRGYEFVAASGTMPFHLRQRDVYDLIEQSEKNNISFYLGCAMSSICAPVAMASRQPPVQIGYLFHARLLGSAQKTTKTTIVHPSGGRLIDFLAFDQNLGAHIIEAKGSGGAFPYGQLADAIDQCCSVKHVQLSGIPSQQPASLNAAIAFYGKTKVACGANTVGACVRTAVVHVKKRGPTVAPVTTSTPNSLHMLIGLQAVGVYLSLLPAAQVPIANAWTQFNFTFDNGFGTVPVVAVETELFNTLGQLWDEAYARLKAAPLHRSLVADLADGNTTASGDQAGTDEDHKLEDVAESLVKIGEYIALHKRISLNRSLKDFRPSRSVDWLMVTTA